MLNLLIQILLIAAAEIFGATKGSFTGATNKSGFIEEANGGILFLDEAHALKNYQNLLLKVVEEQKVRKIGGKKIFQLML